jgi:hypothetical protein
MSKEALLELYRINSNLESIRWLLIVLIGLIGFGMVVRIHGNWKAMSNSKFQNVMENCFNRGDYAMVITSCDFKLSKHPYDPWSHWFKAISHYKLNERDKAEDTFKHLTAVDPLWNQNVKKYLKAIEELRSPNVEKEVHE